MLVAGEAGPGQGHEEAQPEGAHDGAQRGSQGAEVDHALRARRASLAAHRGDGHDEGKRHHQRGADDEVRERRGQVVALAEGVRVREGRKQENRGGPQRRRRHAHRGMTSSTAIGSPWRCDVAFAPPVAGCHSILYRPVARATNETSAGAPAASFASMR